MAIINDQPQNDSFCEKLQSVKYTGCFTKNGPQKNGKHFWKKEKFYQNYFENQNYNLLLLQTNKNLLGVAN